MLNYLTFRILFFDARRIGFVLLLLISFASNAQEKSGVPNSISPSDTLIKKKNQLVSDIPLKSKTDSLKNKITDSADSLKKINQSITHLADGQNIDFKKYTHGLDST